MARNVDSLTITLNVHTDFYYCPLCDEGGHAHVVATLQGGGRLLDVWAGPERTTPNAECIAWCLEHGEALESFEPEPGAGDPDAWRPADTPDEDCCAYGKCEEDFMCDICLRCAEHCEC